MIPSTQDTIVAVSTGWNAAPLGIVRLSGPRAHELLREVRAAPTGSPAPAHPVRGNNLDRAKPCRRTHHQLEHIRVSTTLTLPADVFCFHAPHSYTGQDVVEIHTVGALPALRTLAGRLIALGARRAWPGEFTARAYLNGRLRAEQVEGILRLIHAADAADARASARLARAGHTRTAATLHNRLLDLLARVEAGIDFADEEDVRFITPAELAGALDDLGHQLARLAREAARPGPGGKPHVALAGLPNAGKSTLFNALLGRQRAIVSPVLGTTRDVLSGEIEIAGLSIVLQDCAGLGATTDELESAAHLAAERTAAHADLVLWLHELGQAWATPEIEAARRLPSERRLLVLSKSDQPTDKGSVSAPLDFCATVRISAATGAGLAALRDAIATALGDAEAGGFGALWDAATAAEAALKRARRLTEAEAAALVNPELVAIELREAAEKLGTLGSEPLVEDVLGRIMARFCVGK